MSLAALKASVTQLTTALTQRLDRKLDKHRVPRTLVNEYVTITAGSTRQYDMRALLGTDLSLYDLKTATLTIRVKDTNPTSPLYNLYANAEAIVSYGVTADERYATIANQAATPVELYIKVVVDPVQEV